jgi:hypothetical protein
LIPNCSCSTGSQRLTSLFQATTYGKVVCTMNIRKQPIKRWFYIDMRRALVSSASLPICTAARPR